MTIGQAAILWQLTLRTDSGGASYKIPDGYSAAYITSARAVNRSGSPVTMNFYVTKAGGSDRIVYSDQDTPLAAKQGVQLLDDPQELRIGPGDKLEADASVEEQVVLTVSGVLLV
jgi:hypothetical protein